MGEFFSTLGAQIRQLWRGLAVWQRAVLAAVLVLVPLGLIWLSLSLRPEYVTLYSNLTQSDQVLIDRLLTESGIPHVIDATDNSLRVRPEDEGKVRLLLVEQGLPHMPVEGYQIFDRQRLGATEFEQRLNFKRALEQELKRRLETLDVVVRADVVLAIPTPTVFTEREKPPTASVTITPARGQRLTQKQVDGIVLIVANAVEGLTPENVIVSDNNGVVLSRRHDPVTQREEERRALRELAERSREEKIMEILNRAYGNKVDGTTITSVGSARVTAEFDYDQIQVEKVTYDPETVVSREYIVSESTEGVPIPAVGVPGVTSNILGVGAVAGTGTQTREESTTEYQAGTTREIRQQEPKLVSLSTAVVVNSQVLNAPPGTPEYIAEQDQIKNLIYAAVGYDPANPDGIVKEPKVEFIRFAPLPEMPTAPTQAPVPWYRNPLLILAALLGLIALALLALLLKPRFAREAAEAPAALSEEERAALESALEQQRALAESAEERARRRRQALIDLADASPEDIERVLRYWEETTETE